jgi:hypothetical protein
MQATCLIIKEQNMTPKVGMTAVLKTDSGRGYKAGDQVTVKRVDQSDNTVILSKQGSPDSQWISWNDLQFGVDWKRWILGQLSQETATLLATCEGDYTVKPELIHTVFDALDHDIQVTGLRHLNQPAPSRRRRN